MNLESRASGRVLAWQAVGSLLCGVFGVVRGAAAGSIEVLIFGTLFLILGLGMWFRQPWVRWVGILSAFLLAFLACWLLLNGPFHWPVALLALFSLWWLWNMWRLDYQTPTTSDEPT